MENEENKCGSRRVSLSHPNQADTDLALAILLQEQERVYTMLTTIESDSDDDESDASDDDHNYNGGDYEFFESREIQDELELLEGEDSNSEQDMEEDDIDPDELSYEELIALGEIIGEEKRGLSLSEISMCLHPYTCQSVECKSGVDRCVICQVEYDQEGEALVALPCEHPFHSGCISKWLQIKKICPICSTEVISPKIARN